MHTNSECKQHLEHFKRKKKFRPIFFFEVCILFETGINGLEKFWMSSVIGLFLTIVYLSFTNCRLVPKFSVGCMLSVSYNKIS